MTRVPGPSSYTVRVGLGLSAALRRARRANRRLPDGVPAIDAAADRFVVLSDMHRGKRDRADDFRRCEDTYRAALVSYDRQEYTLALLGDVEELWQNRARDVVAAYPEVYAAEAAFQADGRLLRFWGNHDEEWASPHDVNRELGPAYPHGGLEVRESILLELSVAGRRLGDVFLVHGHQGTGMSDALAFLARFSVRFIWKPIQHLTAISRNTPSTNRVVREKHHEAMRSWAERQDGIILIAGHTHRPVFASVSIADELERRLGMDIAEIQRQAEHDTFWDEVLTECIDRGWLSDESLCGPGPKGIRPTPDLFNSGCCCFRGGGITAIEIADSEIRLVLWRGVVPGDRRVLARASVDDVYEAMDRGSREPGSGEEGE